MGLRSFAKGVVVASMIASLPLSAAAAGVRASDSVPATVSAPVSDVRAGATLEGESQLRGAIVPVAVVAFFVGLGFAFDLFGGGDDSTVSP